MEIEYLLQSQGHVSEGECFFFFPFGQQGQTVYDMQARHLDLVSGSCNTKRIALCFHFSISRL